MLHGCRQHDGNTANEAHHFGVAYPKRTWHNHLITGIHQRINCVGNSLLGTCGNHNLIGCIGKTIIALKLLGNRLAHFSNPVNGRVMRDVIIQRLLGGVFNKLRCIKIRFAQREAHNGMTLLRQFATQSRHSQGCRFIQLT